MAKIAIAKSLLKEYSTKESNRTVYLNDGDEFQIQLFNPFTDRIAASISIDGVELDGMVVIRPGERIWLERYLDKARKFKFSTYDVEDGNASVDKAIRRNGEVQVRFYHIRKDDRLLITKPYEPITISSPSPYTWTINGTGTAPNPLDVHYSTCLKSDAVSSLDSLDADIRCFDGFHYEDGPSVYKADSCLRSSSPADLKAVTLNADMCSRLESEAKSEPVKINAVIGGLESNVSGITCNCCVTGSAADTNIKANVLSIETPKTKETGRTEKGSYSSQSFRSVDYDFEPLSFMTETLLILPASRKVYSSNDLKKVYCTNCGRKLNPKYKFCPYCGEKCE